MLIFQSQKDDTVNFKGVYQYKKKMKMDNLKIVLLKESNHSNFSTRDLNVIRRLVKNFVSRM